MTFLNLQFFVKLTLNLNSANHNYFYVSWIIISAISLHGIYLWLILTLQMTRPQNVKFHTHIQYFTTDQTAAIKWTEMFSIFASTSILTILICPVPVRSSNDPGSIKYPHSPDFCEVSTIAFSNFDAAIRQENH